MPGRSDDVRSSGKTGSNRQRVKTTLLTRSGNCPGFPVVEFEATVWFWELDPSLLLDARLIWFAGGHSLDGQPQRKQHKGKMNNSDAIIIGAGPAGLACAASMGALGLNATVLEKENTVGSVWRRHYDRHQAGRKPTGLG